MEPKRTPVCPATLQEGREDDGEAGFELRSVPHIQRLTICNNIIYKHHFLAYPQNYPQK